MKCVRVGRGVKICSKWMAPKAKFQMQNGDWQLNFGVPNGIQGISRRIFFRFHKSRLPSKCGAGENVGVFNHIHCISRLIIFILSLTDEEKLQIRHGDWQVYAPKCGANFLVFKDIGVSKAIQCICRAVLALFRPNNPKSRAQLPNSIC